MRSSFADVQVFFFRVIQKYFKCKTEKNNANVIAASFVSRQLLSTFVRSFFNWMTENVLVVNRLIVDHWSFESHVIAYWAI